MHAARPLLKPRPRLELRGDHYPLATKLLRDAILTRTCIIANYNRGSVKLAPHVLYRRDDTLFLDAVTLERDGRTPLEPKLGAFRLSGLTDLRSTREQFSLLFDIPPADEKYAAGILARI